MCNDGDDDRDPRSDVPPDPVRQIDDPVSCVAAAGATGAGRSVPVPMARPVGLPGVMTGGAVLAMEYAAGPLGPSPEPPTWYPRMSVLRAIVELLLLLPALVVGAFGGYLVGAMIQPGDARWPLMATNLGMGVVSLAAVVIMLLVARQGGGSIGWTARRLGHNVLIALGALLGFYVVLYSGILAAYVVSPRLLDGAPAAQRAIEQALPPLPMVQVVVLMIATVLWEEVVFRGFLLTRMRAVFRSWWLAVPIGSLLFAVAHYYEGVLAMVVIGLLALLMSILFVWRRSLVPCLVLHWLHNIGALLLLKTVSTTWR